MGGSALNIRIEALPFGCGKKQFGKEEQLDASRLRLAIGAVEYETIPKNPELTASNAFEKSDCFIIPSQNLKRLN